MSLKIQVVSDIHFESCGEYTDRIIQSHRSSNEQAADVLVLAGDISTARTFDLRKRFFDECVANYENVLIVPGNHEFYHNSFEESLEQIKKVSEEVGMTFLNDISVTIKNVKFFGSTLWSKIDPTICTALLSWPDFRTHAENTPAKHNERFEKSFKLLQESEADVVVTHFAPSYQSCSPQYKGDQFNSFFMSDLDSYIEESKHKLWIHGHVHNNVDYTIGNTRIVCNPFGYTHRYRENPDFVDKLIVEV